MATSDELGFDPSAYEGRKVSIDLKHTIANDLTAYDIRTTIRELIQNADDAGATRVCVFFVGGDPHLPELVVVVNNADFRVVPGQRDDIDRFCRFHSRGKESETSEVIGKFGIGRVACYHLADEPSVVTWVNRKAWMELPLDLDQERAVRHLQRPEEIDEVKRWTAACNSKAEEMPTLFLLKVRRSETAIGRDLRVPPVDRRTFAALRETLSPDSLIEMLLFLEHVQAVEVWAEGNTQILEAKDSPVSAPNLPVYIRATRRSFLLDGLEVADHLVLSTAQMPDSRSAQKDDRRHWGRRLAYGWEAGAPAPIREAKLHCYLPTSIRTGFPFHVHASFLVKMDRAELQADSAAIDTNGELLDLLGQLFLESLPTLREMVLAAGDPARLYSLFPVTAGPSAPPVCQRLVRAAWTKASLIQQALLLDQTNQFRTAGSIQVATSEKLASFFAQSEVVLLSILVSQRYSDWLGRYEREVCSLGRFEPSSAVQWLAGRVEAGTKLESLDPSPKGAGSVIGDLKSYTDLLTELKDLGLQAERLSGICLGLAADGCLWPLDEDLRDADQETHEWLSFWEHHLGVPEGKAPPSAYLLSSRLPPKLKRWIATSLGKTNRDFVAERVGETHSAVSDLDFVEALGGVSKAIKDLARFLKFLCKLDTSETSFSLPDPLVVGFDRSGQVLRSAEAPYFLVPEAHIRAFFREEAVVVVDPQFVLQLGTCARQLPCFKSWRACDLLEVARGYLPKPGESLGPTLQPPFRSEDNLINFLELIQATWDETAVALGELPLFPTQGGVFSAIRRGPKRLLHRPPAGPLGKELEAFQREFPSPTLLSGSLCVPALEELFEQKLGLLSLDSWGYLNSAVFPHLSQRTDSPKLFTSLLDALRRLDSLEQWDKEPQRRATLSQTPFLLTAADSVASPDAVYETDELVKAILGEDVPVLHKVYRGGPVATVNERLGYLRRVGLERNPRPRHLVECAQRLAAARERSSEAVSQAQAILDFIATLFPLSSETEAELEPLRRLEWLPAQKRSMRRAPGPLFAPEDLVTHQLDFLIWSQLPCLHCKSEDEVLEWLGVNCGPISIDDAIQHLLFLRDQVKKHGRYLEDLENCLAELGNCEACPGLSGQSVFPLRSDDAVRFVRATDLLPKSEKAKLGDFWRDYISKSAPGFKLAKLLRMPSEAGPPHYSDLLEGLSRRYRDEDGAPLSEEHAKLYWNALHALAAVERIDGPVHSRLRRLPFWYCLDHRFRVSAHVWTADRADLSMALQTCGPEVGSVEHRAEFLSLYESFEIPYLSESHTLEFVESAPAAKGTSLQYELQDWNHPDRINAYRRCWHHFKDGVSEFPEPDFDGLEISLVDTLWVKDVFCRKDQRKVAAAKRQETGALRHREILLRHDVPANEALEALARCLAEYMSQAFQDPPELAPLLFEKILVTPVGQVSPMLDRANIRSLATTLPVSPLVGTDEGEVVDNGVETRPGSERLETTPNVPQSFSSVNQAPNRNQAPDHKEAAAELTNDGIESATPLAEVLGVEPEALVEARDYTLRAPKPAGTRADKETLWDTVVASRPRKSQGTQGGKDVFVGSHYRSRPGSAVPDAELNLFWNYCYNSGGDEGLSIDAYVRHVENALRRGDLLPEERVDHHLKAIRSDLELPSHPDGGPKELELLQRKEQFAGDLAVFLKRLENGRVHDRHVYDILTRHGRAATDALLGRVRVQDVLGGLGLVVERGDRLVPEHWEPLLQGHRAKYPRMLLQLTPTERKTAALLLQSTAGLKQRLPGLLAQARTISCALGSLVLQEICALSSSGVLDKESYKRFLNTVYHKMKDDLEETRESEAHLAMVGAIASLPKGEGFSQLLSDWNRKRFGSLALTAAQRVELLWWVWVLNHRGLPWDGLLGAALKRPGLEQQVLPDALSATKAAVQTRTQVALPPVPTLIAWLKKARGGWASHA